jgi:DNA-binding transcriptional LysR family regulator
MGPITTCYGPVSEGIVVESLYLKTLVEVIRTGSLSRAAETLHVTQPAVSRRIKFMEDQYGCELLDRSGNTLRPTEAGRLVYDKAKSLLEIEADLVSGLHRLDGKARISLSCTPSFGIAHLPAVLREFMLACGDAADLKFLFNTPDQILHGLKEGLFDLAIMEMCERFDLSGYATYTLPGDEMVFASSPALAVPETTTILQSLLGIPLYTRREGCCSRMMLERNLSCIGHQLDEFKRVIVFDDIHVIVKAVLAGEGLAFLSRDVLQDHLAAGRLRAHYVEGFTHARERAMILNQTGALGGPILHFVTALFDHFSLLVPGALRGVMDTHTPPIIPITAPPVRAAQPAPRTNPVSRQRASCSATESTSAPATRSRTASPRHTHRGP